MLAWCTRQQLQQTVSNIQGQWPTARLSGAHMAGMHTVPHEHEFHNWAAPGKRLPDGVHVQLHLVQVGSAQRLQPQQLDEGIDGRVDNACSVGGALEWSGVA